MKTKAWRIEEGAPYPMGVSLTEEGANFALFSIHAEKVELCLFDKGEETRLEMPSRRGSAPPSKPSLPITMPCTPEFKSRIWTL